MKFSEYVELIKGSVAEEGYDGFHPSMCQLGPATKLHVLDGELGPDGDEEAAKHWAGLFASERGTLFLAYRSGGRRVDVCEIVGRDVTKKIGIEVKPYDGQPGT